MKIEKDNDLTSKVYIKDNSRLCLQLINSTDTILTISGPKYMANHAIIPARAYIEREGVFSIYTANGNGFKYKKAKLGTFEIDDLVFTVSQVDNTTTKVIVTKKLSPQM